MSPLRSWAPLAVALAGIAVFMAGAGAAPPAVLRGNGFALKSTSIELPYDETGYPEGPGADLMNANCASCHSASMVLTQPKLSRAQWEGIVHKMRDTYRAPIADQDMPRIVDYLDHLR